MGKIIDPKNKAATRVAKKELDNIKKLTIEHLKHSPDTLTFPGMLSHGPNIDWERVFRGISPKSIARQGNLAIGFRWAILPQKS